MGRCWCGFCCGIFFAVRSLQATCRCSQASRSAVVDLRQRACSPCLQACCQCHSCNCNPFPSLHAAWQEGHCSHTGRMGQAVRRRAAAQPAPASQRQPGGRQCSSSSSSSRGGDQQQSGSRRGGRGCGGGTSCGSGGRGSGAEQRTAGGCEHLQGHNLCEHSRVL